MTTRLSTMSPVPRRLVPLVAAFFFGGVALWVPIEKPFLTEIGFTPRIGLMAAAYAAVVPLLEIPSGILADRWSRRGVLVIGNAVAFLSVLGGGLSTNVTSYVVAALLGGVLRDAVRHLRCDRLRHRARGDRRAVAVAPSRLVAPTCEVAAAA